MKTFKSDNRKLQVMLFLGAILIGLAALSYFKLDKNSKPVWTTFLSISAVLFILIPLLIRNKYLIVDNILISTNRLNLWPKKVRIDEINRIKTIDKPFPATAYLNNILWLFLTDKKFKRIKYIELYDNSKRIGKIDGHFLSDESYAKLKKKLKKGSPQQSV